MVGDISCRREELQRLRRGGHRLRRAATGTVPGPDGRGEAGPAGGVHGDGDARLGRGVTRRRRVGRPGVVGRRGRVAPTAARVRGSAARVGSGASGARVDGGVGVVAVTAEGDVPAGDPVRRVGRGRIPVPVTVPVVPDREQVVGVGAAVELGVGHQADRVGLGRTVVGAGTGQQEDEHGDSRWGVECCLGHYSIGVKPGVKPGLPRDTLFRNWASHCIQKAHFCQCRVEKKYRFSLTDQQKTAIMSVLCIHQTTCDALFQFRDQGQTSHLKDPKSWKPRLLALIFPHAEVWKTLSNGYSKRKKPDSH